MACHHLHGTNVFRLRGTRRPPPRPPRSTTLERSLPRSVVDARAGPPAVDQVNASADVEPDQPDDACSIPSQLLTVEMLRRPLESTQYLSIRYTERLAEAGIEPSVGSVGALPCSAARRYHWMASASSCGTPRPSLYMSPRLCWAPASTLVRGAGERGLVKKREQRSLRIQARPWTSSRKFMCATLTGRAWSACSPAFGGHPASIVPAAYSSVPKTGQNRRTSRPHLALRGTTWHKAPPTCTAYMRVRRTSGIATSCHPAQLPREDRARPPGRRATVAARGR